MARSAILNVMVQAAMKAGRSLVRDFGEVENLQVSLKGPGDYVSQADRRAEEIVHAELSRARPDYSFLMEESGAIEGSRRPAPLDRRPARRHHELPARHPDLRGLDRAGAPGPDRRRRHLQPGHGRALHRRARCRRLHERPPAARRRPAQASRMPSSAPACRILAAAITRPIWASSQRVMGETAGIRRMGAAALDLAYVAAGRLDGFWEEQLHPWDIAAGILMVREAGGFVSDLNGGQDMFATHSIVAGNEPIHAALSKLIRKPGETAR